MSWFLVVDIKEPITLAVGCAILFALETIEFGQFDDEA
jgi:hypothetical protein